MLTHDNMFFVKGKRSTVKTDTTISLYYDPTNRDKPDAGGTYHLFENNKHAGVHLDFELANAAYEAVTS